MAAKCVLWACVASVWLLACGPEPGDGIGVSGDADLKRDAGPLRDASASDVRRPDSGSTDMLLSDAATAGSDAAAAVACDVPAPTACPDPMPTFADVEPIIGARCLVCHYGAKDGPWPLTSYSHVADWHDTIRGAMLDCTMPPPDSGMTMPVSERVMILEWLRCGFPR